MGDIVKLALRLFIFALVASVLLAITNEVTKGPIGSRSWPQDGCAEHGAARLRIRTDWV